VGGREGDAAEHFTGTRLLQCHELLERDVIVVPLPIVPVVLDRQFGCSDRIRDCNELCRIGLADRDRAVL
jgi:hypothetical protein